MKIVLPFLMSCILAFAATALTSLQAQDIFVPRQVKASPVGHVSRQQPQGTPQQEIIPYDTPWKNWIAKGMFPYHRLVLADFPVNDRLFGEQYAMSTLSFSFPQFNYACVQTGSQYVARVTAWKVMSGIYRDGSARKSNLTNEELESGLPHEQTHLDINEIHARRLANVPLERLPIGRGETVKAAINDLHKQVILLLEKSWSEARADQEAYEDTTLNGLRKAEQKKAQVYWDEQLRRAGITKR